MAMLWMVEDECGCKTFINISSFYPIQNKIITTTDHLNPIRMYEMTKKNYQAHHQTNVSHPLDSDFESAGNTEIKKKFKWLITSDRNNILQKIDEDLFRLYRKKKEEQILIF